MSYGADGEAARHSGVLRSLCWGLVYHVGSLAFGAFLIAVIQMIKVIFEYLAKKGESVFGKENCLYKIVICYIRYYIWYLDQYVKFINKNAYI